VSGCSFARTNRNHWPPHSRTRAGMVPNTRGCQFDGPPTNGPPRWQLSAAIRVVFLLAQNSAYRLACISFADAARTLETRSASLLDWNLAGDPDWPARSGPLEVGPGGAVPAHPLISQGAKIRGLDMARKDYVWTGIKGAQVFNALNCVAEGNRSKGLSEDRAQSTRLDEDRNFNRRAFAEQVAR